MQQTLSAYSIQDLLEELILVNAAGLIHSRFYLRLYGSNRKWAGSSLVADKRNKVPGAPDDAIESIVDPSFTLSYYPFN